MTTRNILMALVLGFVLAACSPQQPAADTQAPAVAQTSEQTQTTAQAAATDANTAADAQANHDDNHADAANTNSDQGNQQ